MKLESVCKAPDKIAHSSRTGPLYIRDLGLGNPVTKRSMVSEEQGSRGSKLGGRERNTDTEIVITLLL